MKEYANDSLSSSSPSNLSNNIDFGSQHDTKPSMYISYDQISQPNNLTTFCLIQINQNKCMISRNSYTIKSPSFPTTLLNQPSRRNHNPPIRLTIKGGARLSSSDPPIPRFITSHVLEKASCIPEVFGVWQLLPAQNANCFADRSDGR